MDATLYKNVTQSIVQQFRYIVVSFFKLLFPVKCLVCSNFLLEKESLLCLNCLFDITNPDLLIDPENLEVQKKFYGKCILKHHFSFCKFRKKKVQQVIYMLKYNGQYRIGEILGYKHGKLIYKKFKATFDLIIPVPLHRKKIKSRGYNQSDYFAKGLSQALAIPWSKEYLFRIKNSISQTQIPDRLSRWENSRKAFCVHKTKNLVGKNILLVDDVVTSGCTLEACIHELTKLKVKSISIATIAYT